MKSDGAGVISDTLMCTFTVWVFVVSVVCVSAFLRHKGIKLYLLGDWYGTINGTSLNCLV